MSLAVRLLARHSLEQVTALSSWFASNSAGGFRAGLEAHQPRPLKDAQQVLLASCIMAHIIGFSAWNGYREPKPKRAREKGEGKDRETGSGRDGDMHVRQKVQEQSVVNAGRRVCNRVPCADTRASIDTSPRKVPITPAQ